MSKNTRWQSMSTASAERSNRTAAGIFPIFTGWGTSGLAWLIAAGSAVSFLLMPRILHFLGIRAGGEEMPGISFHPVVFFLTILLVSFKIWAGGRKPVKMAASVSPVEALGWRTSAGGKNFRKTGRGGVLTKMVRLQLTKDRK